MKYKSSFLFSHMTFMVKIIMVCGKTLIPFNSVRCGKNISRNLKLPFIIGETGSISILPQHFVPLSLRFILSPGAVCAFWFPAHTCICRLFPEFSDFPPAYKTLYLFWQIFGSTASTLTPRISARG